MTIYQALWDLEYVDPDGNLRHIKEDELLRTPDDQDLIDAYPDNFAPWRVTPWRVIQGRRT